MIVYSTIVPARFWGETGTARLHGPVLSEVQAGQGCGKLSPFLPSARGTRLASRLPDSMGEIASIYQRFLDSLNPAP